MYVIETLNLTKSYGKNRGIIDVNIKVKEGEIFGFIGPNGAGKSTLIRTLLNFIYPTTGGGYIFEKDIVTDSKIIKESVGYVPSEIKYYGQSYVKDILEYAKSFKKEANEEQIKELVDLFDIDMNKKMSELSLGNKKKIAIAQALLGNPKLLILDEPTSGLDPLMQKVLFDTLIDYRQKGNTVFLSSHNLIEVGNLCDRVTIIKEGKIIETIDLKSTLSDFGRIIEIEGDIPKEFIEEISTEVFSVSDNAYKFLFKGDIDKLIKSIAQYEINNLSIRKENLEDTFIKYYEGNGE
ncbi:MAG: ABC transporter ATP-binding protein [Tissierellaceae bacterium]|nr:ABC transporter ATP-binding protein [Tissierellaceae bacterium]